jgi:hypothetical protein
MPKLPCPHPYRWAPCRDERPDDLEQCDGLMVLVLDPVTGAADTYGPYDAERAQVEASGRRIELDRENLTDVCVTLVRHHRTR